MNSQTVRQSAEMNQRNSVEERRNQILIEYQKFKNNVKGCGEQQSLIEKSARGIFEVNAGKIFSVEFFNLKRCQLK